MLITGSQVTSLWFCPGTHTVLYHTEMNKKLANVPSMELFEVSKYLVFIGHENLQHAGAGWKKNHPLQYHTNKIPEGLNLKYSAAFVRGASFGREAWLPGNDGSKNEEDEKS